MEAKRKKKIKALNLVNGTERDKDVKENLSDVIMKVPSTLRGIISSGRQAVRLDFHPKRLGKMWAGPMEEIC